MKCVKQLHQHQYFRLHLQQKVRNMKLKDEKDVFGQNFIFGHP